MTVLTRIDRDALLSSAPPVIHDWLNHHGQQPETVRAYRAGISLWLAWCDSENVDPLKATRAECAAYATFLAGDTKTTSTGRVRQPRTRARLIATVASLYDHLDYDVNPVSKVKRPGIGGNGSTDAITAPDAARLLEAARGMSDLSHLAISTLLATGVRASGLLSLDVENLRVHDGRLIATVILKGGEPHDLPLPDSAADVVDRIRGERAFGPMLLGPRGRWSYDALHETVVKAGVRAGLSIRVTPHVLRATWATIALSAGVSPAYVQSVMGHKNITTTLKYDRRSHDLSRRAEAMDAVADVIRDASRAAA